MDDSAGYLLKTYEVESLERLHEFLLQNDKRSKIQKISLVDSAGTQNTISLVVESLVVK